MKNITFMLVSILVLVIAGRTEEVTWTGDVNASWNEPGNWSNGKVPGREDIVTIPEGTPPCMISGTVEVTRLKNFGEIQVPGTEFGYGATVIAHKFENVGIIKPYGLFQISMMIQGTVFEPIEIYNSGQLLMPVLNIRDASSVVNAGIIDVYNTSIQTGEFVNEANAKIDAHRVQINGVHLENWGEIKALGDNPNQGISLQGNSLINNGSIQLSSSKENPKGFFELLMRKWFENWNWGKIVSLSANHKPVDIHISSPILDNYGNITGYKATPGMMRADTVVAGKVILVGDFIASNFKPVLAADRVVLTFHTMLFEKVDTLHIMQADSSLEFRGDKGSIFHVEWSVQNMLYSALGDIHILSDTIRLDWSTLEDLCDPDPITGPADTNYFAGHIFSASVMDTSSGTGSIRVYLQNQGTGHRSFDYSFTSPEGWITPVTGSTALLPPFAFDSVDIQYAVPSQPTVKTSIIEQVLTTTGGFSETTFSSIFLTDSVSLGIEDPQPVSRDLCLYVQPNPFHGRCRITAGRDAEIRIYDLTGQKLACFMAEGDKAVEWQPGGALRTGYYLVEARSGHRVVSLKIVYLR
jgi:hypothetical protein